MKNKFRICLYVIMFLWCIVFVFYVFPILKNVYSNYQQDRRSEQNFEDLKNARYNVTELQKNPQNSRMETVEECDKEILPEYEYMYSLNKDFYGWIQIEDTSIDYPVMYTPNNADFYLYKDFYKDYSRMGSIYLEEECKEGSENLIIYGHNMKDSKMFGYLTKYMDESFYKEHRYINFDTVYEKGKYEIIAVSQSFIKEEDVMKSEKPSNVPFKEVAADEYLFYNHVELDSEEEFEAYIDYVEKHSYYMYGTAEYGDKLITLCTCINTKKYQNERLLVVAKKIE